MYEYYYDEEEKQEDLEAVVISSKRLESGCQRVTHVDDEQMKTITEKANEGSEVQTPN